MTPPPSLPVVLGAFYGEDFLRARFLTKVQNLVYEYDENDRHYIIRLTPATHRSPGQVEAELAWVQFLADQNAVVSEPIPSREGRLTHVCEIEDKSYTAAVFRRAPGRVGHADDWTPAIFREWGRTVGQMHRLSILYQATGEKRADWKKNLPSTSKSKDEEIALCHLTDVVSALDALPRSRREFGLIHADFHFWNFSVDQSRITAFDFENSEYHWFLADLGTIIFEAATCFYQKAARADFIRDFLNYFLEGYRQEMTWPEGWLESLPLFVKLREISIFLILSERWRGRQLGAFQQAFFSSLREGVLAKKPFM